jgi:hypothetical protein
MYSFSLVDALNSQESSIQAFGIIMQLANISKQIYHFLKLLKKQSCYMHMFTHHTVSSPVATSSSASAYLKSFTHQSIMSPKTTPMQELEQKSVLTLKQKIEKIKRQ